MYLSFSTWGMMKTPIDVAVDHCARLGYDGLELTVVPRWPTDAAGLDAAARRHIRKLYDDAGIELCGLSGNSSLLGRPGEEDGAADERVARFSGYLDLAAEFQKPGQTLSVSTTSGGRSEDWDAVKDQLVDLYGRVAAHAEKVGVIVGAEPHIGSALYTPDGAKWLVEQIDSPAFRVHFDVSHFNIQGYDMDQVVADLAPLSAHVHVKDERGLAPNHEFLIPGDGDMDYVRYLRDMQKAGYQGHVAVEISVAVQQNPDYDALAAATQSYQVLSKAFTEAGIDRNVPD